jgi:DNA-binding transcriptional MocR family regulator
MGRRPRGIPAQMLKLSLSDSGEVALFVQIREQVRSLIANRTLIAGMRLPPVRALAAQLKVNQITVAKAYRDLVDEGLLDGRRGGGSFVRETTEQHPIQLPEAEPNQPMLAERLYELARAPGVIAFSSNYARLDDDNVAAVRASLNAVIEQRLDSCLHYEPPAGRAAFRTEIARFLNEGGIAADEGDIVVTSGAQQAIDLTVRALCPAGTPVAIEQPAYYGAINALRGGKARMLPVPLRRDGMDLDVLENHLSRGRARLIYTNPTFQNPSGVTASLENRRALLALARRFEATILEDDHSPELRFRGTAVPAIRALATADDRVVYTRSLGTVLLPGLRVGFLLAPPELLPRLLLAKANADLHCSGLIQEAAADYLKRGTWRAAVERMCLTYGARQRVLYDALAAGLPEGASVNNPDGGLSFWLNLPKDTDLSELYFRAVRRGVAFVNGDVFYLSRADARALRVSFGLNKPDELLEGVTRLCSLVKDLQTRRSRSLILS